MRTAYCPKTHEELASTCTGAPYGHVPGHQYRDVDVVVSRAKNGSYRCHVVESWGSAQGYDEEHGRKEVIGRGDTIEEAIAGARHDAEQVEMTLEYLLRAIGEAQDEAEEAVEETAE